MDKLKDLFGGGFFKFKGRINRARYLKASIVLAFISSMILLPILAVLMKSQEDASIMLGITIVLISNIVFSVISIALMVKRLHDIGKSGWFLLLNFIPIINIIIGFFVLIILFGSIMEDTVENQSKSSYIPSKVDAIDISNKDNDSFSELDKQKDTEKDGIKEIFTAARDDGSIIL